MASYLHFLDQQRLINSKGTGYGGSLYFYYAGTSTPAPIYSDSGLTTLLPNPVVVSAGAIVPTIYLDMAISYRRRIIYSNGESYDKDPYNPVEDLALRAALIATTGATLVKNDSQTVAARLNERKSAKDFGAVGDGTTDDTAALKALFASSYKNIHIPAGTYRVSDSLLDGTPVLTSGISDRRITADGTITATTEVRRLLQVTGDRTTTQINVDGNNQIADALRVTGSNCTIRDCNIRNIYGSVSACFGIYAYDVQSIKILNNTIETVNNGASVPAGTSSGYSRGISIYFPTGATGESVLYGNVIKNVIGGEGDGITVLAGGSGTYYDARLAVVDNTVSGFTRRAVKIQANRTRVLNNYFTHSFSSAPTNALTVLDFVQGGNHVAAGNTFDGCEFFGQISVFATTPESFSNFFIENNKILGLTSATTNNVFSISPLGSNVVIRGNYIQGSYGRALSLGGITGLTISDNTFLCPDNAAETVVTLTSSCSKVVASNNRLLSGTRVVMFDVLASNTVLRDNDVKCDTPLFRDSTSSKNCLVINNSIDGTAGLYQGAASVTNNRFGPNYNFSAQAVTTPGTLYTSVGSGPATSLASLSVMTGQVVIDSTPTAGGKIGWVATTDGTGATVTWKQFGAIDP